MSLLEHFKDKQKEAPFLIFISFLISFAVGRGWRFFEVGGPPLRTEIYTLHHLYYGVALLIIAGWIAINYKDRDLTKVNSLIYGAGLGLFFDQIGYMLTHFANYWDEITYTIVIGIGLVLLNVIYFSDFWKSTGSELRQFAKEKNLKYGPLSLMGLVNVLDKAEEKVSKTGRITNFFVGVVLIVSGIMILEYPRFVYYWIAGAFILTGFSYIIEAIRS